MQIRKRIGQTSVPVTQTYHRRQSGGEARSRWAILASFFRKLAILMPLDHNPHVFKAI